MLSEEYNSGINGSFDVPGKRFSINFSKDNTKGCLILHYNVDNSYVFVNGKVIFKFKAGNKNVNFPTQFCNSFVYFSIQNWNAFDFSVDYNSIDTSDVLNIHKYLMIKNNIN